LSGRPAGRHRDHPCISGNLDRSRQRSSNSPREWQRAFRPTRAASGGVSKQRQGLSAARECPLDRRRSNKRSQAMPGWQREIAKSGSMPLGSGARSRKARQQLPRRGQGYRQHGAVPKIGWPRRGAHEPKQVAAGEELGIALGEEVAWEKDTPTLVVVKYFV